MGKRKQRSQIEKERRCQVGLHNYIRYTYENFKRLVCSECKYILTAHPVCYIHMDKEEKEAVEVTDAFKNMNVGHETKDGTINYNKTWE